VTAARVVIVDDDPALLQALSQALQLRLGEVNVETFESAHAALDRLAAVEVDVVVADIKMPKMDGLQLLTRIRELRPDTPTLLITGHGEHELAVQALRGGAYDYVQKPVDRDYFVGSLRRAVHMHQLNREIKLQRVALEQHCKELETCVGERTIELRELYHREQALRAELEEAQAKLVEAERRRGELVSMIAHDLAGPVTALKGYIEILARPNTPPAMLERAQTVIRTQAAHMARLVSDLADAERLASGHFAVQPVACDLVSVSREQVEATAAAAPQHTISLEAPPTLPIVCDPDRVAQVLANILSNAVKYTDGGHVRVRLWTEDDMARLSVTDEGPGIDLGELEAIFEAHRRLAANGSPGNAAGAGLGLHIARGIVEAHGGRVWAESATGQGATFHVMLPLTAASTSAAAQRRRPRQPSRPSRRRPDPRRSGTQSRAR
jgi:signal transduction histidine kinase